jgi:predicted nucleic acid-binding protein
VSDVVVDTDVASTILKGQLPENLARRLAGQRLAITFVTVGELPLATLDIKDYADFAEHEGLEIVHQGH